MKLFDIKNKEFILIIVAIILLAFFMMHGIIGLRTSIGVILLFIVPFYLILNNFDLNEGEKIVFSFFLGIGLFSSIVYWLGIIISFRLAIVITFLSLLGIAFLIKKVKK